MKILFIGTGSIGRRHLSNIFSLGYNDVAVVSSRTILPSPLEHVPVFKNIDEAMKAGKFEVAFVCSPTAFHAAQLLSLLRHKISAVYVEKPVSDSTAYIKDILRLATDYPNRIVAGYDLRFEPGFEKIKSLLNGKLIGKVVSVHSFAGQHLSQWRPYEDYRNGMSAKKETGGGVLLDLVHEFDYLYALIGDVNTVCCHTVNSGALEIETEESADVVLKFENGITATVHLDYLQQKLKRYAVFTGTSGTLTWNLAGHYVEYINDKGETDLFNYASMERNERFKTIVKQFLDNKDDDRFVYLPDALKSLQVVLAAKKSDAEQRMVAVNEIQF